MTTTHQYLIKYPIDPLSEQLIVGTIHPHDHASFKVPFFYGNECSLWMILNEAFPIELPDPFDLDAIKRFLHQRKIAMSDMILTCERKSPTALDKDLIPKRLNTELIEQIRQSSIRVIFFTSGFEENAAFFLFYCKLLDRRITTVIKKERKLTLEPGFFGRSVELRILYSPSGSAYTGLSRNKQYLANREKYRHSPTPVKAFRIDYYRQIFSNNA
jgi:hypothetical protein